MFELRYVFKRMDGRQVKRYVCFKNLENGKFCVQSCDFIQTPLERNKMYNLNHIFYDLFSDGLIEEVGEFHDDIMTAISEFDKGFQ